MYRLTAATTSSLAAATAAAAATGDVTIGKTLAVV